MSWASRLADRYGVVHDLRGPRIRLALIWMALLSAVFLAGPGWLRFFFAGHALIAGLQCSGRWGDAGLAVNQGLAAAIGPLLIGGAWIGNTWFGLAVLAAVVASLAFPERFGRPEVAWRNPVAAAGAAWPVLASSLPVGVALGAATQLQRADELVFLFLIGATGVYDAGDFLCTGGRRNRWIGPVCGMGGVALVGLALTIAQPPPLSVSQAALLGVLLVPACPLGQWLGSWLLPAARTPAPALRRVDSWLLAAPLMLVAVWMAS
jgi:hypothetical protein